MLNSSSPLDIEGTNEDIHLSLHFCHALCSENNEASMVLDIWMRKEHIM